MAEEAKRWAAPVATTFVQNAPEPALYEAIIDGPLRDLITGWIDESLTAALSKRTEPMVRLALAQVVHDSDLLKAVFDTDDEGIRAAVLANPAIGWSDLGAFDDPAGVGRLFNSEDEERAFVDQASDVLLQTYLTNPCVPMRVLHAVFSCAEPYSSMDDDRWAAMVYWAASNPRTWERPKQRVFDEPTCGPYYHDVVQAAWGLLASAPVTSRFARVVTVIAEKVDFDLPNPEGPVALVGEYVPDDDRLRETWSKERQRENQRDVVFFQTVLDRWAVTEAKEITIAILRSTLGRRLAGEIQQNFKDHLKAVVDQYRDSDFREGLYQGLKLRTVEEIDKAYKDDGIAFLKGAAENEWYYRQQKETREISEHFRSLVRSLDVQDNDGWDTKARVETMEEELEEKDPAVYGLQLDDDDSSEAEQNVSDLETPADAGYRAHIESRLSGTSATSAEAYALQQAVIAAERQQLADGTARYGEDEARLAAVHTRQDVVLLVSYLLAASRDLRTIKRLLLVWTLAGIPTLVAVLWLLLR